MVLLPALSRPLRYASTNVWRLPENGKLVLKQEAHFLQDEEPVQDIDHSEKAFYSKRPRESSAGGDQSPWTQIITQNVIVYWARKN